ncbi:MAG: head-tail adaptor protein [Ruminococcus sp.]|nr:head-tail adaptor protein [Ruminococcus sp.]
MSKTYDKPITIQKIDEKTEIWTDLYKLHACINKAKSDDQYLSAGSTRTLKALTFDIRYFSGLEPISFNHQSYRIMYRGVPFAIEDYDDYLERHKNVKLLGVSY